MKETHTLKLLSFVMVTVFLLSAGQGLFTSADAPDKLSYSIYDGPEEKIFCDATIDDDFEDGLVLIVLSKEATLSFKTYTPTDFADINCLRVADLTELTSELVRKQLDYNTTQNSNKGDATRKADSINELASFNRILSLELNEKSKENVLSTIKQLEERGDVLCAGPSYNYHYDAVPNDPRYSLQWGLPQIQAPNAWNVSTGSNTVRVGIIDSGIASHSDLNANVVAGWDFYNNNGTTTDDTVGHGTHVAGIVGAVGNNNTGISGVCWNVKLVPLQVNNPSNNTPSDPAIISAISYATANGIPIINCSIGGSGTDNVLKNAISNYPGLFVCSAGNGNKNIDTIPHSPASFMLNNLITVGATNKSDARAVPGDPGWNPVEGSNYGATTVDIFAPGTSIESTIPGGYDSWSGTSMASPFVAGVAALLLTKNSYSPSGLKSIIMDNDDNLSGLSSYCVSGGRLNAQKALGINLFGGGNGTSGNPYQISTVQHLKDIDKLGFYDAGDGRFYTGAAKYYKLTANITLAGNWTPISDTTFPSVFSGTLDGNGKTISGLTSTSSVAEYFGLFKMSSGTIKNLTLSSVNINKNVGSSNTITVVGAVAGSSNGTIDNCTVNGNIAVSGKNTSVGGIAGINYSLIKYSTNNASVTSNDTTNTVTFENSAGGIVGNNNTGTISYCTNSGAVTGNNKTGGIAGYSEATISNCTVNASSNNVKFSWTNISNYNRAGGIVGETFYGKVENCTFNGMIKYTNASSSSTSLQPKIGQIVGYSYKTTLTSNTGNGSVDKGTLQTVSGHNQALYAVQNGLYGQQVV